jgi:hypothetical protein
MIKSIKGDTSIHGNTFELTLELHHLIRELSVVCPSILTAVIDKDVEFLVKASEICDLKETAVSMHIIDMIDRTRKEHNNGQQ